MISTRPAPHAYPGAHSLITPHQPNFAPRLTAERQSGVGYACCHSEPNAVTSRYWKRSSGAALDCPKPISVRPLEQRNKRAMKTKTMLAAFTLALAAALAPQGLAQTSDVKLNRTVLPIPEPNYPHSTILDARDAKPPPRFEIKAPAGAPNVLIVLVDDIGFGMP